MSFPFAIEDIEAAYKEIGAKPYSGIWATEIGGVRECCPLSALAACKVGFKEVQGHDRSDMLKFISETLGITRIQVDDFIDGFDGCQDAEYADETDDAYGMGIKVRDKFFEDAQS